jgi:hypothetical protein
VRRFVVLLAVVWLVLPSAALASPPSLSLQAGKTAIVARLNHAAASSTSYSSWTASGCWQVTPSKVLCTTRATLASGGYCPGVMYAWVANNTLYTQGVAGQCVFPKSAPTYTPPTYTTPTVPAYTPPPVYTPPVYTPPVYTPPVYTPPVSTTPVDTSPCPTGWYKNVYGTCIPGPSTSPTLPVPGGPTAICMDGTYSYSQSRSGTCSYHGGVLRWLP